MEQKKKKIPNYLMFNQAYVDLVQAGMAWYETVAEILLRSNISISLNSINIVYAGMSHLSYLNISR